MPFSNEARLLEAKQLLRKARRILILSGQGLSVASSVPALTGPHGPWESEDHRRCLDPRAQEHDPRRCWETLEGLRILMDLDRPTAAHLAIARFHLSRSGVDHFTLSVDGMHERSGALPIEMLGSFHRYRCMDVDCGRKEAAKRGRTRVSAFCPDCKSRLRHDLVFDGEQMRYTKEYHRTLETAEVLLLAGTNGNLRGFDSVRWMEERDRVVISVGENPGIIRRLLHSHQISLSADTVLPHLLA